MKRWALVTVLLYAVALVLLTAPLLLLANGQWWGQHGGFGITTETAFNLFKESGYWV